MQCMATAADGSQQPSGELVIPAISYGLVAGAFRAAAKQLQLDMSEEGKYLYRKNVKD